mmetsp:Transcript_45217/g.102383  ORF Transcript_45217/g.102383 Transcript_45217/m.102383 type:complete len:518 (-) Transcript_45217:42-1595(-)
MQDVLDPNAKIVKEEPYCKGRLTVTVLGASGDLAKKKTYPALYDLFVHKYLPAQVRIVGYARSAKADADFRQHLRPFLEKICKDEEQLDSFLAICTYFQGNYDSEADFARLDTHLKELEGSTEPPSPDATNRLFYFAIPPDAFLDSARSIRASAASSTGFTRLIVEKPFGHDLASAQELVDNLGKIWSEDNIFRIDHYLGKEIVQNLTLFRFGNTWLEPLFNSKYVASVRITFKENFGTEGRGGYFTNYGIIRDVIQNHLMQVLSLVAMEAPPQVQGPSAANGIRDAKNRVLKCVAPIRKEDVVLGQYVANGGRPGYLDDDSIKDKERAKRVATFAQVVMWINNPRWEGVPFIVKAGKALNERKAEIRIQFKDAPASKFMFDGQKCPRNELVMRLQPDEAVYMKVNVKEPGLASKPVQSELDLSYKSRYEEIYSPDAYTRLLLEALRGNQENFVRSDNLLESWKLFTPLLEELDKEIPLEYRYGSRGPQAADDKVHSIGFHYDPEYKWKSGYDSQAL